MADLIKNELGLGSELIIGYPGEFKVLVDGEVVVKRGFFSLPSEQKCLAAVKNAPSS